MGDALHSRQCEAVASLFLNIYLMNSLNRGGQRRRDWLARLISNCVLGAPCFFNNLFVI